MTRGVEGFSTSFDSLVVMYVSVERHVTWLHGYMLHGLTSLTLFRLGEGLKWPPEGFC